VRTVVVPAHACTLGQSCCAFRCGVSNLGDGVSLGAFLQQIKKGADLELFKSLRSSLDRKLRLESYRSTGCRNLFDEEVVPLGDISPSRNSTHPIVVMSSETNMQLVERKVVQEHNIIVNAACYSVARKRLALQAFHGRWTLIPTKPYWICTSLYPRYCPTRAISRQ
jgi:hypothetical protein